MEDYQARNSLANNIETNDNNFNNPVLNNLSNKEEKEKEKTQKSNTNRTNKNNSNRTIENKNIKDTNYHNNTNVNEDDNNEDNNNEDNNNEDNNNNIINQQDEIDKSYKQEILSFLLNADIKSKAVQKREESEERRLKTINSNQTKSKKYQHVESKYKKEKLENDPLYKSGPEKFFINLDLDNPEFKADKQNAQRKLLLSNKNASGSEKDKIIRKLLSQDIHNHKKIDVDKITNNDIKNKVSYYLNKKQKKLDEIESLKDEMVMKNCTFQPEFVSEKLFPQKREFKTFLEDQKNHLKRLNDKLEKVIYLSLFSFLFNIN